MHDESYLILGGAGLVGLQVARRIASHLKPRRIIIASLYEHEVVEALDGPSGLRKMFPNGIEFTGEWGNIFVRSAYTHTSRTELLNDPEKRAGLYDDLFGPVDDAYDNSRLVSLILKYRPDVIVDAINTATAISYQDLHTAAVIAKRDVDCTVAQLAAGDLAAAAEQAARTQQSVDTLAISLATPQLIRHLILLNRAMREVETRLYLKVGTTGTGGMGLNIPYTHSEDKPSTRLLTKTAMAFAHTGLLFLLARTEGGPIVKEIKPGAMIGYADVSHHTIRQHGQTVYRYKSQPQRLGEHLTLRHPNDAYEQLDELQVPVVDTGENGVFTRGEFEAITTIRQMEFMTPEEIAMYCVHEIRGSNSGYDMIGEIDSAVMNPTYRAGVLRQRALDDLARLEEQTETHSVALGQLGPPELSKLLWEAELLRIAFRTLTAALQVSPEAVSSSIAALLDERADLRHAITSIGVPILAPDGQTLDRGPFIRIPEVPGENTVALTPENIDTWARKGWVDLRPANFADWQERFRSMAASRERIRMQGTASVTREAYLADDIRAGAIVGWIFNNETDGYRVK